MTHHADNILVLSSDTGGGHRSAAAAIVAGMRAYAADRPCNVHVVRAVEESDPIAEKLVRCYNWLLRHKQHWMKYLYWSMDRLRPESREFFYRRTVGYVRELIDRYCPQVIVSVHPLTLSVVGRTLREFGLHHRIPLVCVVTDPCYGFWKAWACSDVTLYLVANEAARRQLVDYGVAPERIRVCGMPVHPKFASLDRSLAPEMREELGLEPDRFTVFLNAGCEGGGNMLRIFREFVRGRTGAQAIFLAGRNRSLRTAAERIASEAGDPVCVVGYTERIEQLMNAAHVMVSKTGGLTTFEALSCRIPIITDAITRPMPQEEGTAQLIFEAGAGVLLRRARHIAPLVRRLATDSALYNAMCAAAARLCSLDATRQIVREIVAFLPVRVKPLPHPVRHFDPALRGLPTPELTTICA